MVPFQSTIRGVGYGIEEGCFGQSRVGSGKVGITLVVYRYVFFFLMFFCYYDLLLYIL